MSNDLIRAEIAALRNAHADDAGKLALLGRLEDWGDGIAADLDG